MNGKNLQPRILYPARLAFRFYGEFKSFPDRQKLRQFSTTKTSFTTNEKELTSLGRKQKTRKRHPRQKINPRQLRKW